MPKNMHRSEDQGNRDFTKVDPNILAEGSPTEELSSDPSIARGWATYTDLNPMDADVLNQKSGAKQQHDPHEGPVEGETTVRPK
jgi:hypothetical protein